ncbi:hypothetical protein BDF21DRAFT_452437 [Thamnidium elegans]|uniref:Uncharacterized protein n=1 Tax=Thamnidium elegans TaxID=101142 RepID=A0A8H7VVZ9_9FUNG|nr:hypothetical protein INT48_000811 [Thamnidium elegans]KAI8079207.1 hypothetical protein BDF21DRAFT_452437 [Thamnidium elegans]
MSFIKKLYDYRPWGATSIPQQEVEDIEQDYCIIKYAAFTSVHATLSLINAEPVNWYPQELLNEFTIVRDNLYNTCHQFDQSRITEQFSSTHLKIGAELKYYIHFISDRYKENTWLTLIGLLMIAHEVLQTPSQVKTELIHVTRIGRDLALTMSRVIQEDVSNNNITFDDQFKSNLLHIFVNHANWFLLLKDTCFEFGRHDSEWEFKQNYYQVVSMATQLLLN